MLYIFLRGRGLLSVYVIFGGVRDSLGFRRRFLSFGKDRGFGFDGIVDGIEGGREGGRVVVV